MYLFRCTYFILSVSYWRIYIYIYLSLDLVFFILYFIIPFSFIFYSISYYSSHFTFFVLLISFNLYFYSISDRELYLIVISIYIKGQKKEKTTNIIKGAWNYERLSTRGRRQYFSNDNGKRYTSDITLFLLERIIIKMVRGDRKWFN